MIKTIIFDFGGVIGTDSDTIFIDVLTNNGMEKQEAVKIWEKHWPKLKDGTESVKKIWESVQNQLSCDISKIINEYENKIQVYSDVFNICKKLKSDGYKLGILANESLEWMNIKREKGNLNQIFDKVYSSADIGLCKPNKESYEFVLKSLGSKPGETLFIDNKEQNTKTAENIGLNTILFIDSKQLKKELASFSIHID